MTIDLTDNAPRVSYTVSEGATQTSFTVPFEFFDAVDLKVVVDGTTKTITTHYTVSGGNGSTGTVTMSVTGATGGSTVIIFRDIAFKRTTDFPTSGAFPIATLNTELDRNIALFDDQQDRIDRSVRLNDNDDAASMVLPLKASRVGTVLGFNATTGAAEAGPTIANVNSLADITTNINTVAGISSNVTTVAGISSNVTTVAGISSAVSSVAGVASLITSDFVSDLNTLATSAIVEDLNILATSDIVSDLNTLATTDIVSDLNTLATADIVSDLNTLATSDIVSDLNQLATSDFVSDLNAIEAIKANVTSVAGVASNVTTVAGISSNVSTVAGVSSNVSTVAGAISNVNSVASNISNVNTVATQLLSSSPTFTGTISAGGLNIDSDGSVLNDISLTFQQTEAQSNAGTLPEVVFKSKTANKEGVIQQSLGTLNIISKDSGLGNYGTVDIFVQDSDASNLTRVVSFGINEHDIYKRLHLALDGTSIKFGNDGEVTITHVHDTGLLLNSTSQLQFGDSGTYIHQSADGVLDLVSDTEIEINATTIDMNGNVDISGTTTLSDDVTFTGASYNVTWDKSANLLQFADNAVLRIGTGNDLDIYHSSDVTFIKTQTDLPINVVEADGNSMVTFTPNGETVFNDSSQDRDFRVESDGNANMLFVDAGNNCVNIGTTTNHGGEVNIETTGNATNLALVCTDTDANAGPFLVLRRDAGNVPSDDDAMGAIIFENDDTDLNMTTYAMIDTSVRDSSNGTEAGRLNFHVASGGSTTKFLGLIGASAAAGAQITFNEDSNTVDFRIESDDNAHMFFLDATNNRISIGGQSAPQRLVHIKESSDTKAEVVIGHPSGGNEYGGFIRSQSGTNQGLQLGGYFNGVSTTRLDIKSSAETEVAASSSGGGSIFRIKNTSNTANSTARLIIQTGGSSGGDAFITFDTHNSLETYMLGVDKTDQKFCLERQDAGLFDGTNRAFDIDANGKFRIFNTAADYSLNVQNSQANANNVYGQFIQFTGVSADNRDSEYLIGADTSTTRFKIYGDGDIENHDNSYGSLSDRRIKQDIVDANSQWDDIKAIKIRNYKKKDDINEYGDKATSQIGVIAQELETVSPNLIKENLPTATDIKHSAEFGTLYTKDDAETQDAVLYTSDDEEVKSGDKEVGDVKTSSTKQIGDVKEVKQKVKGVKYSVLYMKAVKALQEAMTRIETLEAKVAKLEGA